MTRAEQGPTPIPKVCASLTCASGVCSFKLPAGLGLPNLKGLGSGGNQAANSTSGISRAFSDFVDPGLTWEFVAWVREFCSMAILVKVGTATAGRCLWWL